MSDIYRTYLRLLLRSPLVRLSLGAAVGLAAFGPSLPHSAGSLGQVLGAWLSLTTLGVILVATGVAQQDGRERVAEVIGALPVSNAAWLLGRLAAAVTVAAGVAPLQVLAAAVRGLALGGAPLAPAIYLEAMLMVAATQAVAAAFGFALGLTAGRPLVPVLLGFLFWAATVLGMRLLLESVGYGARWPLIFGLPGADPTLNMADWFPQGRLMFYGRVYYLGQAALCTAAALWLWNRSRPGGTRPRAALAAGLAAILVMTVGLTGFTGILAARDRAVAAEQDALSVAAPADPAPGARVLAYDVNLNLDLPRNRVQALAEMELAGGEAPARELVFALRPGLRVSAVTGAELLEQSGQFVRVRLPQPLGPGQTATVALAYSGQVMQWRETLAISLGYLGSHITPSRLLLTGNYGWYPLLGNQPLARVARAVPRFRGPPRDLTYNALRTHPVADFRLQVQGAGELPLFSNLPAVGPGQFAGRATAVYLLGDRLEPVQDHGIEVLAPRDAAGTARLITRLYARSLSVLADLAPRPDPAPPRFILLPEPVHFSRWGESDLIAVTPGAVLRNGYRMGWEVASTLAGTAAGFVPEGSNLHQSDLLGLWWPAFSSGSFYPRVELRNPTPERWERFMESARENPEYAVVFEAPEELALGLLMADMHDYILVQSATRVLGEPTPPAAEPTERLRQFWYQNSGGALQVLRELHALRGERPLTRDDLDQAIGRAGGGN